MLNEKIQKNKIKKTSDKHDLSAPNLHAKSMIRSLYWEIL